MNFTVEVEGAQQLLQSFLTVQQGLVDLRQLGTWDAVQAVFYKIEKEQFGSEGSAGQSGKWAPLSPKYAEIKQKRYGTPILQVSGRLYKSLTSAGGDAVVEKKPQELTLGSSVPYGAYHQRGTKNMPAREPLSFTPDQERQLMQPIQDKLKQLIANARLRDERGF